MKQITLIVGLLVTLPVIGQEHDYIFQSGFEGTTQIIQYYSNGHSSANTADIEGVDNGYDWVLDLDNDTILGKFRIFYEVGDISKSIAEIVEDPINPGNNTLRYYIKEPHISYVGADGDSLQKGRIQAGLNGNINLKSFGLQVKLYLHPDLIALRTTDLEINWFTLQEFWNNESMQEYPFRVTLNMQKPAGIGAKLHFGAHGQTKSSKGRWESRWEALDTTYEVPLGQWITLETHFLEGDSLNGRFKVTVTDSLHSMHEIVNITGYTRHPDDPDPDGVTSFNPMKLYTFGALIETMDSIGANLSIYWDDFKIWVDSTSGTSIGENEEEQIYYYPNPTNGPIRLNTDIEFSEIVIINTHGAIVEVIKNQSGVIDMSKYEPGLYIVQLKSKYRTSKTIKVVKN